MKNDKDVNNINPYELDKLSKIPSWLIIILLKYWAAAAAVYFGLIGGISFGLDISEWNDPANAAEKFAQDEIIIVILAFGLILLVDVITLPVKLFTLVFSGTNVLSKVIPSNNLIDTSDSDEAEESSFAIFSSNAL